MTRVPVPIWCDTCRVCTRLTTSRLHEPTSPNSRLFHTPNLSVRNFRIFCSCIRCHFHSCRRLGPAEVVFCASRPPPLLSTHPSVAPQGVSRHVLRRRRHLPPSGPVTTALTPGPHRTRQRCFGRVCDGPSAFRPVPSRQTKVILVKTASSGTWRWFDVTERAGTRSNSHKQGRNSADGCDEDRAIHLACVPSGVAAACPVPPPPPPGSCIPPILCR